MADDNNQEGMKDLGDLSAKITKQIQADALKQKSAFKGTGKEIRSVEQGVKSLLNTLRNLPRAVRPGIKELKGFEKEAEDSSTAVKTLTNEITKMALVGRKSAAGAAAAIKGLALTYHDAAAEGKRLSKEIDSQSKEFSRLVGSIANASRRIGELRHNLKNNIGDMEAQKAEMQELISVREQETQTLQGVREQIERTSESYNRQTEAVLRSQTQLLESARNQRALNREMRAMEGGLKALSVPMEAFADSKFFDTLEMILKGGLIVKGVMMINEGTKKIGQYYKVNSDLSRRLGVDAPRGFGAFVDAAKEAQATAQEFALTSAELGMALEEVSAIGDKIRVGIKVDAQGKLGEGAVRKLTKEVARFSQTTGVDADTAVQMLDTRMKSMSMTADQAAADLMSMRVQLQQMTIGAQKNNVPMEEMVELINKASAESQSYIVDTRLMTQALRAAADQASRLGLSQKAAKEAAEASGKALGKQAEYIEVPVGLDLADMLLKDADKVTRGLTEIQKKGVLAIKAKLEKGELTKFAAGAQLMEQLGGATAGMEAKMEKIMQIYGDSPVGAYQLAQQLNISNTAAQAMLDNWRQAENMQRLILQETGQTVDKVALLENKTEKYAEALKGAKTDAEKMTLLKEKMLLSDAAAAKYMEIQNDKTLSAKTKLAKTAKLLVEETDPMKKAEAALKVANKLKASGKSPEEIAKTISASLGLQSDGSKEKVLKAVSDLGTSNQGETRDILKGLQEQDNKMLEAQTAANDDMFKKMSSGFQGLFSALITKVTGGALQGPLADLAGGLTAVLAGGAALFFGRAAMINTIALGVAEGNAISKGGIAKGLFSALMSPIKTAGSFLWKLTTAAGSATASMFRLAGTGIKFLWTSFLSLGKAAATSAMSMLRAAGPLLLQVGLLAAAAYAGYKAGQYLNNVLNDLGLTGESTIESILEFAKKFDWLSEKLSWLLGADFKSKKQLKDEEEHLRSGQTEMFAKRWNISAAEYEKARNEAKKQGVSTTKYLESLGKKKEAAALPEASKTEVVVKTLPNVELRPTNMRTLEGLRPEAVVASPKNLGNVPFSVPSMSGGAGPQEVSAVIDATTATSDDTVMVKFVGLSAYGKKMDKMAVAS